MVKGSNLDLHLKKVSIYGDNLTLHVPNPRLLIVLHSKFPINNKSFISHLKNQGLLSNYYEGTIGHFRILGIGLELACNGGSCGGISLERHGCNLHLKRLPRISLTCKLVPVQYREYENGLLFLTLSPCIHCMEKASIYINANNNVICQNLS